MDKMSDSRKSFFALGLVGLFLNISTTCIFGVLPLYMRDLGASVGLIAQMDSIAEMLSYASRVFIGGVVDIVKRRKILFVCALAGLTLAQYGFFLVGTVFAVSFFRCLQRFFSGLVAVPRDVMTGSLLKASFRARGYAMQRIFKVTGSLIGASLSIYFLTKQNYFSQTVICSASAATISTLVAIFFFKETPIQRVKNLPSRNILLFCKELPKSYWGLWFMSTFFFLGHFSETLLFFQGVRSGVPQGYMPLSMVACSLGAMGMVYPIGSLGDRWGFKKTVTLIFFISCVSNISLMIPNQICFILGATLWGAHTYSAQTLFSAAVTKSTKSHLAGTAFGIMFLSWGLALVAANAIARTVLEKYGYQTMFGLGSVMNLICCLLGAFILPNISKNEASHAAPLQK